MLYDVRSYSVALWLYSKGHQPVDAGFTPGGTLLFTFMPEAEVEMRSYTEAKAVFNNLEAKARAARLRVIEVPTGSGKSGGAA
jgi:hypothetical protein